jgi:IPT/TIG domain/S-layer homology domain
MPERPGTRPLRRFFDEDTMRPRTLLVVAAALFAARVSAATLTVFTTADAGAGSLRQAITDANLGPGVDLIVFNLPGIGVHTISLASPLPTIVESVEINGYSQPGALENTLADGNDAVLLIEIDGSGLPSVTGLLDVLGTGTTIRGLVINRGAAAVSSAISLGGGGGHVVSGNFIGTDAAGAAALPNDYGIRVSSGNNLVGGDFPAARNLISGNAQSGITMDGAGDDNAIRGNFIGTDRNGTAALGNGRAGVALSGIAASVVGGPTPGERNVISGNLFGIESAGQGYVIRGNFIGTDVTGTAALPNTGHGIVLAGDDHLVGGVDPGAGNLISGNVGRGILIQGGSSNTVQGNRIGTDLAGTAPLPNGSYGINVQFGSQIPMFNLIGGTNASAANVIAFNGVGGIAATNSQGTTIRFNRIFRNVANLGSDGLGIDLDNDGVTPNDDGDADAGANGLLNFPLIRSVTIDTTSTRVIGTFQGAPDSGFWLDFYWSECNLRPRDFLEGENHFTQVLIFTDATGFASFDITAATPIPEGAPVSATATDEGDNTSEFSQQIVFAIAPASGTPDGGSAVAISGTNFDPGVVVEIGGVPAVNVVRVSSVEITAETPALPPGSLNDVVVMNPDTTAGTLLKGWVADFLDVPPAHQFYAFVTRLVSNGVTVGCGGGLYCVGSPTTREQMAVFLIKARLGFCFTPPPATGTVFADVPASSIYAAWIEELERQGLTAGCGGGNYCPDASVTRAQMAVFLLNTAFGPGHVPPPPTGTVFDDVPLGSFADEWIEDLVGRGITAGCSVTPPLYCPLNAITRGQMATFITITFDLQP